MKGKIVNTKNAQEINVKGSISGIIPTIKVNKNQIASSDQYYCQLQNISVTLTNTNYGQDAQRNHILDFQHITNLGRQKLADKNPLMGKQLDVVPSAINNIWLLNSVQWDIIEYQIYDADENDKANTQVPTLHKTRLATPQYINQFSNRFTQQNVQNNDNISEQTSIGYYAYILYNKISILTNLNLNNYNADDLSKFIGPTETLNQLINILQQYATVHNVTLKQISETEFELI